MPPIKDMLSRREPEVIHEQTQKEIAYNFRAWVMSGRAAMKAKKKKEEAEA